MIARLVAREPLVADFLRWAGNRAWIAVALTLAGAALEGVGLVMLIPVIGIVLAGEDSTIASLLFSALAGFGIVSTEGRLATVSAIFAVLIVLRFFVGLRRDTYLMALEQGFIAYLRRRLFRAIAVQPWAALADLRHGPVGHALSRDVDRTSLTISSALRSVSILIMMCVQVTIAIALAPRVTLAVLLVAGLAYAALAPARRRAARLGHQITETDYQLFASTSGFLRGLKPAKAHGFEQNYLDAFGAASDRYAARMVEFRRDIVLSSLALQGVAAIVALGVILAGHSWLAVDPATLAVVLVIMVRFLGPLQTLQQLAQHALHGRAAYQSAIALTEGRFAVSEEPHAQATEPWPGAPGFELQDVSFAPESADRLVLSRGTAWVPAGQVTAIAGPSGVGKTTLCDLIVGLHEPTTGRVLVDGEARDAMVRARIQASLAYVGQEGLLPQETVREALTWGCPPASDDDIWRALALVGADDLIRKAEDGLDTQLSGEYSRFSGGERQRLRLARAVLRRPRLIVLDEATNALDLAAEREVLKALFAARGEATVIMVSHRPETVDLADHVIRLEPPGQDAGAAG